MGTSSSKIKSLTVEIAGWLMVVVGVAALVLPGPGLLALFAGIALLSTRHKWAKRRLEPAKKAAMKAARDGVSNLPRIISSVLAVLALICLGVVWGLGPAAPSWWPLANKFWLIGGWGAGGTLIGSGIIAGAMLVYSYIHFRVHIR